MKACELIELLQKIPNDANVVIDGPDVGGYDMTYCDAAALVPLERSERNLGGFRLLGITIDCYDIAERTDGIELITKFTVRHTKDGSCFIPPFGKCK